MVLAILFACNTERASDPEVDENWPAYLGSKGSSQYSSLEQINKRNVNRLIPDLAISNRRAFR